MLPDKGNYKPRTFRGLLLVICGVVLIFCTIIFIGLSQKKFESALTRSFNDEQTHHIVLVENLIKDHIKEAHLDLLHLTDMFKGTESLASGKPLLDRYAKTHNEKFHTLSLLDPDGNVLVSSGLSPSDINLFQYVEIEEKHSAVEAFDPFISERIISDEGTPATFLFVPFYLSPKQPKPFFVVGELNLKVFVDKQLNYIRGEEVYFILADYIGDIYSIVNIAHRNLPEMEKGNLFSLSQECLECHMPNSFDDLKAVAETGKTNHSIYKAPNDEIFYRTAGEVKIFNEKWVVSITQPHSRIQGQISQNFRNNAIAVAILLISTVLGIFFFYRQSSRQALDIQYLTLVNSLNVGIVRTKESGEILSMNQAMLSLLGLKQDNIVHEFSIKSIFPHRVDWQEIVSSLSKPDSTAEGEFWLNRRGENDFLASFSMRAVKNASEEILYIDGVIQDVTDKKRAEEERIRLSRLDSIELLAGGIAHDFNNLLTAIVGNISLSRMAKEPKQRDATLQMAEEASFRAQGLTQQLLTFSKGGSPVQAPDSIERLIRENANFVLHGSKCNVEYSFSPDLKLVNIDTEQIEQVIQNLVINAEQAMHGGGTITISAESVAISRHKNLKPGEYVRVSVQDDGAGMSSEVVSKIFDPYFSTKATGSGLGLAVSSSVINKHSGTIYADSILGRGTTIIFYLPVAKASMRREHDVATNNIIFGSGQILVIDDDQSVGETMVSFLDELGYEPYFVTTGEEAIRLLKEEEYFFDAVMTDLTIPGCMDGVETKDQIRQLYPDMKIIVMSGYSDDPILASYKEYGFNGKIKKPFRINLVAEVLHTVLLE